MVTSQFFPLPPKPCQSLRERRQVALSIVPISYRDWNKVYNCNCELVLIFEDEGEKDQAHSLPPPSPTPSLIEECHLVEIMDGLYIALVDDEDDLPALRTFDSEPFTHVVQVSYILPGWENPLLDWRGEESPRNDPVQHLELFCPAVFLHMREDQTTVGPKELHAAREFLTLALPYGSTKWWPEELRKDGGAEQGEKDAHSAVNEQDGDDDANVQVLCLAPDSGLDNLLNEQNDWVGQDDKVNVLIVAPTSRAVDVLSVLFCYLLFLEETTPDDLVETDYFDQVWDNVTFQRWCLRYVEMVGMGNLLEPEPSEPADTT
ncbi:hypothetical protein OG21DRAFT_1026843 [Imleria badia]|nr:hypothetical protein OG21DRAFT_1026843 [Imleria badia]